ncbi:hypothetical protein ACEUZ9_002207 [Paracoccus litorisediminis]|uniref:hypothetical protein n=1 Tax=Paracoccus litorisediminis TaxID=2006130 RepID=UPI003733A412
MTNIFGRPGKLTNKNFLFSAAVTALEGEGWKVEKIRGSGKGSVRRITRGGESKTVSIRTTQDTWIAFPRDAEDKVWSTLDGVDAVVAASVDDRYDPKFAQIHMLDGDDVRARFDRAYKARLDAGYQMTTGRGMWVSLYHREATEPVTQVGAGAGLATPPFARFALADLAPMTRGDELDNDVDAVGEQDEAPLTIAEAKRRLALTFGVDPESITIKIEG